MNLDVMNNIKKILFIRLVREKLAHKDIHLASFINIIFENFYYKIIYNKYEIRN